MGEGERSGDEMYRLRVGHFWRLKQQSDPRISDLRASGSLDDAGGRCGFPLSDQPPRKKASGRGGAGVSGPLGGFSLQVIVAGQARPVIDGFAVLARGRRRRGFCTYRGLWNYYEI